MTKATAAQAKLGIATIVETDDLVTVTLKDGRVWAQATDDATPESFVGAAMSALEFERDGFEGIAENESVTILQAEGEDFVARLVIAGTPGGQLARDPVLADLMETLEDEEETLVQVGGIREDVNGDEGEEERTGSVVPDAFKKRYAEAGHPGHCGDWLALQLNGLCQTMGGKKTVTDLDRLEAIANANGVAPERFGKLGVATNGWQGRFRMTVRNMLAKVVADKGFLFVPEGCGVKTDEERKAPKDWCAKYATKVKAKAAPKAAVAKDEGAGKPSAKTKALEAPAKPAKAPRKPRAAKAK